MFDAAFLFEGKNTKKAKLESAILNCVSIETASFASANSETASFASANSETTSPAAAIETTSPAAAIETASSASANSASAETSRDSKFKKIAKKVLSVLLSVFLVLSTTLCILVAVNNAKGNDNFFGYGIYYVVTGSMEPTIHVGAAILVKENESQIYQVGDIVTFTSANPEIYGKPNTHRIIAVDESTGVRRYMTQGDANNVPDAELITANSIRGKMVWSTESLVWIATLMGVITTPMGFISMVLLPVLLIVVNQMKEFTRDFKDAVADAASEYAVDPANAGPANGTSQNAAPAEIHREQ